MTIKIFNDDPDGNYIFPVLTTGQGGLKADIWLQAFFKVPNSQIGIQTYLKQKSYRIYIASSNVPQGIPPGKTVWITVPLYTQLVATPSSPFNNQYIDWWNGGTIQLFTSPNSTPPKALTEDLTGRTSCDPNPCQQPLGTVYSDLPSCNNNNNDANNLCPGFQFFTDTADLDKNDPSQLLEYTMGARVELKVVNDSPPNKLDIKNVDFDVSYVNLTYGPATMGPVGNDQVGYVGTPKSISDFKKALCKFGDYSTEMDPTGCVGPASNSPFKGWPRFLRKYSDNTQETLLKLPSPLEILARITPDVLAPPDLTPAPPHWPDQLWKPVQDMRDDWKKYAGTSNPLKAGLCKPTYKQDTFCDAIVEAKKLMMANYNNYKAIFNTKCKGTSITISDDKMVAHVYGWAPFTEATTSNPGDGCPADVNLLENTPGGYKDNNYALYSRVKLAFDKLNYGPDIADPLVDIKYPFNPWVQLIHGKSYVGAPNVYAYSVDDAVGNIQAYGTGFIVDVGSTVHLENQDPAAPPINIAYAVGEQAIQFTNYRICKNDLDHDYPVNVNFQSFVISANNPIKCPIFFYDNKSTPQLYSFTVTKPPPFTFYPNPTVAPFPNWTEETAAVIDCSANAGPAPYQQSSKSWCCEKLNPPHGNGVYAYSKPEPHNAHKSQIHTAVTHIAEQAMTANPNTCNMGK